jgi:hypothetical protein
MQTLGFIAFGAVDLIVFSAVITALIWAAVKDGQKQRSVQEELLAASPVETPRVPAPPKRTSYKLAVAH